jgi:N6-L-threonylcarbamoyladenine synthase
VLEKHKNNSATLHFHSKITSDNRQYKGVSPIVALHSHQRKLAGLVNEAIQKLPLVRPEIAHLGNALLIKSEHGTDMRRKPDFVTVTRGPGMRSNLLTGLDTAKGLAVAWQVPFLGVNHMQAHALTPRLVSALAPLEEIGIDKPLEYSPAFPFLSLLVSGGNTMLVHSKALCDHEILSQTVDIAIGDMIDKCARDILPNTILESSPDVSYGPVLENYAFPDAAETGDYDYHPPDQKGLMRRRGGTASRSSVSLAIREWAITPPLSRGTSKNAKILPTLFSFSGIGSAVQSIMKETLLLTDEERVVVAREAMRVAFEHLASRVFMALKKENVEGVGTLVVAGGVASNQYLKHILRALLDANGYADVNLVFPPPTLCTDNAAMIGWTGIEMFDAGYRTDLEARALAKWAIDPNAADGGILGPKGWMKESV